MSTPGLQFTLEYPKPEDLDKNPELAPGHFQNLDIESTGDNKTIVIVLFGWTGAKDKQLAKYSDIYLNRGCIIARSIVPLSVVIYKHAQFAVLAVELVQKLKDTKLHTHPIFFHAFSNAGPILYSCVLKEIANQRNSQEFDIRGTILDSGPFWPTAKTCYAAMAATCNSALPYNFGLAHVFAFLAVVVLVTRLFWMYMKAAWECGTVGTFKRPGPVEQKVEIYPLCDFLTRIWKLRNHPRLFLYSETDVITPVKELEEIAGAIRDRGSPTTLVKFEGSAHVLHYKMHPTEYVSAITKFIDETMESNLGPAIYWDEYN